MWAAFRPPRRRSTEISSRYYILALVALANLLLLALGAWRPSLWWGLAFTLPPTLLGCWDLLQTRHSLLRNYPLVGHTRWLFEGMRPEIRQYLIESDRDAVPFSREERSLVYQRAKDELDAHPFGTEMDVYQAGFAWLNHSVAPMPRGGHDFRVRIGGGDCAQPYDASILNVSAMSFGALSGNAILALNRGAAMGGFAHDTGEGGISRHHRRHGGDLIWEIGSGYFGCRDERGGFDPALFAEQATLPAVRMLEVKLSQGAKPGHGGILPAAKLTAEIAEARRVPLGRDCVSPAAHPAFSTPLEMMRFLGRLRELGGGKPVGFKLCVGHRWEFMALLKAMLESGIRPDFVVVDGKEGGSGAAPLEFSNHVGTPLVEGLHFVHQALIGAGLRPHVRVGASGKIVSAFDMARAMALGADWCNAARGFMFALGCIQAQSCHTNRCPVGVATQDPLRQRALVVDDKATRVCNFHRKTLEALAEVVAAAGLEHPRELQAMDLQLRQKNGEVLSAADAFPRLSSGELLDDGGPPDYREAWALARADSFRPAYR